MVNMANVLTDNPSIIHTLILFLLNASSSDVSKNRNDQNDVIYDTDCLSYTSYWYEG